MLEGLMHKMATLGLEVGLRGRGCANCQRLPPILDAWGWCTGTTQRDGEGGGRRVQDGEHM